MAFDLFSTPQYRNVKKRPPIFKEAEWLKESFQQYEVVGYRWNRGGAKRVLIIHGFESSVINFDHFVRPLIKLGYEVLAFDAPAHGRSSGKRVNALIYRDMILFLYEKYGPIHSYMAHSFGSLAVALALEKLPRLDEQRLVLIAPLTETTRALESFFSLLRITPPVQEAFGQIIEDLSGQPPEWYSLRRIVPTLSGKILWLHDTEDKVTPWVDAEPIQKMGLPHVEFVVSSGLGHRRIYRDNQVKKKIISFLGASFPHHKEENHGTIV